jgi:hypothetical protein
LNVTSAEINNTNFWNNLWGMQTAASTNNKILWLSNEPLITIFQNPDPAWTVLAGDAAVNEWYSVRDAWLAAHPGDCEQYRIDWFAQHGIPPNGETIELGFASGPTSGSFNLTDYGRDLDTWGLRRGCSLGIKLTPNSANMNTTILTLGHMTLSVAGDTWTFSAEGGRTVSVVQPYSAGVQVFLRMRTNPYGWISLKVDNNQVDTELADESAGFFAQPVTSGTFGFTVDLFRLCPFYLRNWEWSLWT